MGYFLIPPVDHSQLIKLTAMLRFTAEFPDDGKIHIQLDKLKQLVQVSKNGVTRTYSFDELINGE